jgi:predicted permease
MRRRRKDREQDLDRELRNHLELETEAQSGSLPVEEACDAARRALGNQTLLKEDVRAAWGGVLLDRLWRDFRYGLRALRANPGFTCVAVLTLAIGIGANTAIFSVTDAVLLKSLPYPNVGRLMRIWQSEPRMGEGHLGAAPPEFLEYRRGTRAFSEVAGYQRAGFDLTGNGEPEHLSGCRSTASMFSVLGVPPLIGRTFTPEEERPGTAKVVVLSFRYWKRRYAGDPRVLGSVLRLNEQAYRIVGVMPRGFTFPSTEATPGDPPAFWTPLSFTAAQSGDWASSFDTSMVARLREGLTLAQARGDVHRVATQFQREHPDIYSGNVRLEATVEPWAPDFSGRVRIVLWMLSGAVGFVMLIACANVANLLLARNGAREREISIRRALGATPARLIGQMLTETAVLVLAGTAAGCAIGYGLTRILPTLWTGDINLNAARLDTRVLLFAAALTGVTCLLCGLIPAWSARQPDVNRSLRQSARQAGNRRSRRAARLLILGEVACSVLLLTGAGLLLRSFLHVLQVPLGFRPDHVLLVRTTFNRQRYASSEKRHAAERTIASKLSSLPGVAAIAVTTHVPLADERQIGFVIDGAPPDEFHWADNALVSRDYFAAMGIPLIAGRAFSDGDTPKAPLAAVVNQTMARQYWPNQDPLGKGFRWGGRHLTVIGVSVDLHAQALDRPIGPAVYNSVYQVESGATTSGVFVIRTRAGQKPMGLAAAVRDVIRSVDRGLPILGFSTLRDVVATSLAMRRTSVKLAGGFALIAALLALIGVYGVLSYAVGQRTRELGVRLALGASPAGIVRMVVAEGFRLTVWGLILGAAGGAVAGALLSKLLFGVRPLDPLSLGAAVAGLLAVSLLASYVPARRAARVDPMSALRHE